MNDIEYLNGLLDGLDDLSDEAWQQVCLDRISIDARFKGCDPFDVWVMWLEANA